MQGYCLWFSIALAARIGAAGTPPAHSGWQIVSGASDLIDNAYWDALYQGPGASIAVASGSLAGHPMGPAPLEESMRW